MASGQQFQYKLEVIGWTGNDRKVGIAGDDHIDIQKNWSQGRKYDTLIMFDGGGLRWPFQGHAVVCPDEG